jgi:hypothetical protein
MSIFRVDEKAKQAVSRVIGCDSRQNRMSQPAHYRAVASLYWKAALLLLQLLRRAMSP